MLDDFDYAVINFAREKKMTSSEIYLLCEKCHLNKGYRYRHTVQELLNILEQVKKEF